MIKKLKTHTISDNGIRREIVAPLWEQMEKINEIIEVVNKLEEDKVSRKPNGHYPGSCMSCTATHPND